ncbi:uncharacterized protein LOC127624285 [Xyrauchen texanus]|uniref:uncharacterized protein LOC127624285 n=1 Tax=Xyrauchen texanus TaxID=154827 RepID=UPI0022419B09|nr:uncharacterized protein LOC127624285 [Xyrauchen texanus]
MSGCCVYGCTNRYSTKGLKFYRIPTGSRSFQKNRRRLWLQAIKRVDWSEDIIKNARVCSAHFISGEASLDCSSPDFVPSVFVYTKPSQNPEAKLERYHRKRRRDDRPITAANLCVSSKTLKQECSMDHCPAEDNIPVTKREYDDLNQRHCQLQEDYVHLCQKFEALQAENVKLKEELQKSTFSYTTVKCNIGQLFFLTGLTSVLFEWLDKQITKESGFLELLEPRDEVLADRGFLIRDELAAYGATLRIPHFTKGKKQLSAQEVDTSRQLSRVRIHVERVIGRWKNFKILQTVIPVSQVNMLDDVVTVCGALTNLCKSVVSK